MAINAIWPAVRTCWYVQLINFITSLKRGAPKCQTALIAIVSNKPKKLLRRKFIV
jgi:hypothetical protein